MFFGQPQTQFRQRTASPAARNTLARPPRCFFQNRAYLPIIIYAPPVGARVRQNKGAPQQERLEITLYQKQQYAATRKRRHSAIQTAYIRPALSGRAEATPHSPCRNDRQIAEPSIPIRTATMSSELTYAARSHSDTRQAYHGNLDIAVCVGMGRYRYLPPAAAPVLGQGSTSLTRFSLPFFP